MKHAVALRAFEHAGDSYTPGAAFPLAAGYLTEWSAPGVGLVREATAAEVAKAGGEKPARRAATKRARKTNTPAPVSPPAGQAPPADVVPDPAAPAA